MNRAGLLVIVLNCELTVSYGMILLLLLVNSITAERETRKRPGGIILIEIKNCLLANIGSALDASNNCRVRNPEATRWNGE